MRPGGKKTLSLRDRGDREASGSLCTGECRSIHQTSIALTTGGSHVLSCCLPGGHADSIFGGRADGLGSEVTAAAPHSYVDAIRTGLDASAQEQGGTQRLV